MSGGRDTGGRDFWSRRRAAVEAEAAEDLAQDAKIAADQERAAMEKKSDAEILEELGLPDPDDLKDGDDVSGFMQNLVPERLRRRALRRFWRMNPVLANVDGLVDYGEDYTDAATVVENLQTAYQVGKGMLAHVEELARQEAEADTEQQVQAHMPPPHDEDEPLPEQDSQQAPEPEATTMVVVASEAKTDQSENDADALTAPRAPRMRFEFEG